MPSRAQPTLLLTRPVDDSRRFSALLPGLPTVISPIIRIVDVPHDGAMLADAPALVFTSGHAIASAGPGRGRPAYCVGPRTAELARGAGFKVIQGPGDAERLLPLLESATMPLIHPRGRHVARQLPVRDVVVYDQRPLALNEQAMGLLQSDAPVILPLFSPRSAALLAQQLGDSRALLWVAAISRAASDAFAVTARKRVIAPTPDAPGLVRAIRAILAEQQS
ncbi:uroporphyrinogen-III synthase [Paracoccus sp. Z330]|uniref:Uroporphyrinogen-III synthase n=1 Tax=Paracoccus onchidii TaxID=3017813 RepID=A0ABT4ZDR8_9RHOB|nr:uroporphyrinogen-III synthase [Paracoccus onchidii]MDB6176866.1 uroporphyrinogen-III synthase [Paracoccus onchidii]